MGGGLKVEPLSAAGRSSPVAGSGLFEDIEVTLPQSAQVIHGDTVETLLGVPGDGALVGQLGDQPHYVVADPDLLNNHGIRRPEAAARRIEMLARMMPDEDSGILFDTGGALQPPPRRNLLRSMFEPPFLAMTLALLVAALLAGLYGVGRFGPARRPVRAIPFGKAALVENSAGLVRLAGREVRLGAAYASLMRDEAARAGAAPPHLQGEALEAYLDRFSKTGEPVFQQLAWDVREARDRPSLLAGRPRSLCMEKGHHPVTVDDVQALGNEIRGEVAKAVVGHDDAVELMLIALFSSGHILLEGPPGTAKTFLTSASRGAGPGLRPHPVHAGPDAGRHPRLQPVQLPDQPVHAHPRARSSASCCSPTRSTAPRPRPRPPCWRRCRSAR
jgi:hypothetical protein